MQVNYFSPQENLINNTLHRELLFSTLAGLNDTDLKSASLVCKCWNAGAKEGAVLRNRAIKNQQFTEVENFSKFLAEQLSQRGYAKQSNDLLNLCKGRKELHCINLLKAKESITDWKSSIAEILKEVPSKDLVSLKEFSEVSNFKDVFELAVQFKAMDTATNIDQEWPPIIKKIAKLGYVKKALDLSISIPFTPNMYNIDMRMEAISQILEIQLKKDEANLVVATLIKLTDPEDTRDDKYVYFANSLAQLFKLGHFEEALEVAKMIPEGQLKYETLLIFHREAKEKGMIEIANQAAMMLPRHIKNTYGVN